MFEKEAEEYAKTNALKGFSYRQITETYDEISGYPYFLEDKIKQAYLAGVEAGKPKWHKVADGDLPKENKLYLVAIKDNGLAIAYFNGLHWETKFNLGDFGHCVETVIAWCEIPQYKEE